MPTASATTHSRSNGDFPVRAEFPRMGGVVLARFCLCNGVFEPSHGRFVSALKIPFPGNGDFGSKRLGSNAGSSQAAGAVDDRWIVNYQFGF